MYVGTIPSVSALEFRRLEKAKAEFTAWMRANMTRLKLSQNELSRRSGVGVSTINRYCDENDSGEPRMSYVRRIAEVFGAAPPSAYMTAEAEQPGMAEPGLALITERPENLDDWNGNISQWTVRNNSMQVAGYITGDRVKADARIIPVDGDVVVANIYDPGGEARTVLRIYKAPGYLMPATNDATAIEIHEVGKNAAIFGVVFESIRKRSVN